MNDELKKLYDIMIECIDESCVVCVNDVRFMNDINNDRIEVDCDESIYDVKEDIEIYEKMKLCVEKFSNEELFFDDEKRICYCVEYLSL